MLAHILRRGFNVVLAVVILLAVAGPMVPVPTSAAPSEIGIYTEDFSTYANKDHTGQAEWNTWTHSAYLDLLDAYYRANPSVDSNGGYTIAVWDNAGYPTGWNPSEIFAQRLDNDGNRLWATNVRVNATSGTAKQACVAVDTNGNAFVVWEDTRNGNRDIYAQRLNAAGNLTWGADIRVNSDAGTTNQSSPTVGVDDNGGIVVVWSDYRNGNWDIYAQRLNATGDKLWMADVRVNSDSGNIGQYEAVVGVDSAGVAYVAWSDDRSGASNIYAQKLSAIGAKLWPVDVQTNSETTGGFIGSLAVDNTGQPVIVWSDWNNIYAQRVDASGNRSWSNDVRVNADAGPKYAPAISADSNGKMIIVWLDGNFRIARNINAQRLDQNGARLWSADSRVVIGTAYADNGQPDVAIIDSAGSALVLWRGDSLYAQRLNPNGNKVWEVDARVDYRSGTATQVAPQAVTSNNDTTIVIWENESDICAQRLDKTGNKLWGAAVRVNSDTEATHHWYHAVVADNLGGATVVWTDDRSVNDDVYIQRLDANGNKAWATDVRVNSDTSTISHHSPAVVIDASGGVIVTWEHEGDIYAQRLDTTGNKMWTADVRVNSSIGKAGGYRIVSDSSGSLAIVWEDSRNGDLDIYAQRLDASGNKTWDADVRVNSDSATTGQNSPEIVLDGGGAMLIIWDGDSFGIYAQRLNSAGSKLWATDVRVNSSIGTASSYISFAIAMDTGTTAVIVWSDERNGNYGDNIDIYGQRLDINANKLWGGDDVRIDSDLGSADQYLTGVWASEGAILITWDDRRNGGSNPDVYAQHLSANGSKLWASDVRVNSDTGPSSFQVGSSVSWGFGGEVFIAWEDYRNANSDVYMQRLNSVGGKAWLADLQVVYPDRFYYPTGLALSRTVDTITGNIHHATLTANYQTNGGNVEFALSNNGGTDWVTATLGTATVFPTTGSDLRWRAALTGDPVWRNRSPIVTSLRIDYSTAVPYADDYEADDACSQAKPIATGGAAQTHTFHQQADADWVWFNVISGTTYILQTINVGAQAQTRLEFRPACAAPPTGSSISLGNGVTLNFTANQTGPVFVKVFNQSPTVFGQNTTYQLSARVVQPTALAVIIAGHDDAFSAQANITWAADRAYNLFRRAGLGKANIRFLDPNPNRDVDGNGNVTDDIAGLPTIENVRAAIQDWPRERGVTLGVPLYIYLVDHGLIDHFKANGDALAQQVTATDLNLWLSNLEATTGTDNVNIIIDACYSGSFIDLTSTGLASISGHNRVVIASTTSAWNAYGPADGQGLYFSNAFFTALENQQSLQASFEAGRQAAVLQEEGQQAWLDDNGDRLYTATDGVLAANRALQRVTLSGQPPRITALTMPSTNGLQAQVVDDSAWVGVTVDIFAPDYVPPQPDGSGTTRIITVPVATLIDPNADGLFTATYPFTQTGWYRLVAHAEDTEGNLALPYMARLCVNCSTVYLPLVRK